MSLLKHSAAAPGSTAFHHGNPRGHRTAPPRRSFDDTDGDQAGDAPRQAGALDGVDDDVDILA
jgi:hypothetical protein